MKKRGILSRLLGPGEFEATRQWGPSLTQPVAQPQPFAPPYERPHVLARYFDLNWRHALASGGLLGLVMALLYAPSAIEGDSKLYVPLVAGIATFAVISSIVWIVLLYTDRLGLHRVEMATGLDLNRDGHIGQPEPEEEWVRTEILDQDKNQTRRVQFKFPHDALSKVAVAVLHDKKNLSRRALADVITETQFRDLQQQMLGRGLCHWKDSRHENLGVELSPGGRAFLRGYLPK